MPFPFSLITLAFLAYPPTGTLLGIFLVAKECYWARFYAVTGHVFETLFPYQVAASVNEKSPFTQPPQRSKAEPLAEDLAVRTGTVMSGVPFPSISGFPGLPPLTGTLLLFFREDFECYCAPAQAVTAFRF